MPGCGATFRNCVTLSALVLLSALAGQPVRAAADGAADGAAGERTAGEPAASGIQEIVVTATRRQERLEDVPISVTALSQETMDQQGLRSIDDVTRLTPGITFQRNGTSNNYNDEGSDINIRGIDSSAGASTTGIYINDTPIQSRHIGFGSVNAFPQLFDLDRVEVLRGPQGTLFGAGAEGGVVRFITPSPSLTKDSGNVRSEVGFTRKGAPSYEESVAAGGPLVDEVLGFRVSVSYRRDGGYVDRVAYDAPVQNADGSFSAAPAYTRTVRTNSNWQETRSVRGELKWAVNDRLSISPSLYYQKLQVNDTGVYWPNLSDPKSDVYRNGNRLANPSTDPFWLAAVKVDWDLGFGQLTSNTSFYHRDQHSVSDYTQYLRISFLNDTYPSSPADAGTAPFEDKQNNIYQEFRIASKDESARITWNGGVFYSHLNENVGETISDPTIDGEFAAQNGGLPLCTGYLGYPCPNGLLYQGSTDRVVDKQVALFGEAAVTIVDTLKVTLGARVARVDFAGVTTNGGAFTGGPPQTFSGSGSEKPVTPKGVVTWQPDRDDLYYVSAAKGYRVGGINVGTGTICGNDLASIGIPAGADGLHHVPGQYSSDSLWSYELGAKNTLLERRLQINSSLFWIDWKNIQQNVYLPTCGEQFVANLGHVVSRGGDIDAQFRPLDALTLSFTAAYTDAKYSKASCAGTLKFNGTNCGADPATGFATIVREGDRLPGAPWTFLTSAEYVMPFWKDRSPYVRADFQYLKAQTALLPTQDPNNGLNDVTIPGLPVNKNLNVRAGFRWSGLDLSVFANNVTDTHTQNYLSRDIAEPSDPQYFARGVRPRTLGITGTYHW